MIPDVLISKKEVTKKYAIVCETNRNLLLSFNLVNMVTVVWSMKVKPKTVQSCKYQLYSLQNMKLYTPVELSCNLYQKYTGKYIKTLVFFCGLRWLDPIYELFAIQKNKF